jgi:hypothetical protein
MAIAILTGVGEAFLVSVACLFVAVLWCRDP